MQDSYSNIHRIVDIDFARHHQSREYDLKFAHSMVDRYIESGNKLYCSANVLIRYEPLTDGIAKFHCMNAGTGADVTNAVNDLMGSLVGEYDRAVTYYDNPRINEIVKFSKFPAHVNKVNGGIDKTYEMWFDLRGK